MKGILGDGVDAVGAPRTPLSGQVHPAEVANTAALSSGKLLSANGRLVLTPLPQPRFLEANDGGGQGGAGMR